MFVQMQHIEQFKQANREWKRKPMTDQTIKNFQTHYVDAYKELLEDIENKEEKEKQQENVGNVIFSDIIKKLLEMQDTDKDKEEQEPTTQFASMAQINEKFLEQLNSLTEKVKKLEATNKCPNNQNNGNGKMAWRKVAPKPGKPTKKMFEGVLYKWCGKCCGGKGLWRKCEGMHSEADHDPSKRKK